VVELLLACMRPWVGSLALKKKKKKDLGEIQEDSHLNINQKGFPRLVKYFIYWKLAFDTISKLWLSAF
jgi:hypothetical protein